MIQIENINVSYQQTLALDNITLNLEGPSITGIIGPNGAGKSTLIKASIIYGSRKKDSTFVESFILPQSISRD